VVRGPPRWLFTGDSSDMTTTSHFGSTMSELDQQWPNLDSGTTSIFLVNNLFLSCPCFYFRFLSNAQIKREPKTQAQTKPNAKTIVIKMKQRSTTKNYSHAIQTANEARITHSAHLGGQLLNVPSPRISCHKASASNSWPNPLTLKQLAKSPNPRAGCRSRLTNYTLSLSHLLRSRAR